MTDFGRSAEDNSCSTLRIFQNKFRIRDIGLFGNRVIFINYLKIGPFVFPMVFFHLFVLNTLYRQWTVCKEVGEIIP